MKRVLSLVSDEIPWGLIGTLLLCSALSAAMILFRWQATGQRSFGWLILPNLLLAWIPFGFAILLHVAWRLGWRGPHVWVPVGLLWLLFLPNAPYMATDLIYIRTTPVGGLFYFDVALFILSAFTGIYLGFASLNLVQQLVAGWLGKAAGWLFVAGVWVLSGVGLYMGRVQRWNSWDLGLAPGEVVGSAMAALMTPEARLFVVVYASVLMALYLVFTKHDSWQH